MEAFLSEDSLNLQCQRLRRVVRRAGDYSVEDEEIRGIFTEKNCDLRSFDRAVRYFWNAQQHYLDSDHTIAYYPGYPSIYGAQSDAIEGVTRLLPLWAAYSASPLSAHSDLQAEMRVHLRNVLSKGTSRHERGYWGAIDHRSTLICEASDVALAVWLARDNLWQSLDSLERTSITEWLAQAIGKKTADNNWHLFVVLIDAVLSIMKPGHRFSSQERLDRVVKMYVGEGCFRDGFGGHVDLYNAWGFHYSLYWLSRIRPDLAPAFYGDALREYCSWYQYLFTDSGFPLHGRSLCYRLAVSTPLFALAALNKGGGGGIALTALCASWRYFIARGALAKGRPTQGVLGDELLWLDPYSGPASAFWGVRPLVILYHSAHEIDWSDLNPLPLPITGGDLNRYLPSVGVRIVCDSRADMSAVSFDSCVSTNMTEPVPQSWKQRVKELIYGYGVRPSNNLMDLGVSKFDSTLAHYKIVVR